MVYVEEGKTYKPDQLLSGTGHKTMELVVANGKELKRGQAVNLDGDLSDGTDLFGIVLEDSTGGVDKTRTSVVVFGEVIFESLKLKSGTDKKAFIAAARGKGIIVKELGGRY